MGEITEGFTGFTPETYRFLMELQFYNDKTFFDANRPRYLKEVREPMIRLGEELAPTVQEIDPEFGVIPHKALSRIRRDTRYSKNKLPYRDHAWLSYKRPEEHNSEAMCMYFEIDTKGYGYGMGMYDVNPQLMRPIRARILADPERFLALAEDAKLKKYVLEGKEYKRDRYPEAPERLKKYLNRGGLSWCYYSTELMNTMGIGLAEEVKQAMQDLAPLYRFIMGR